MMPQELLTEGMALAKAFRQPTGAKFGQQKGVLKILLSANLQKQKADTFTLLPLLLTQ